jgi:ATP-dependent helicase/DNAse subunit B
MPRDDFRTVLSFTAWKIRTLATDLAHGRIQPYPSRTSREAACDHCDFASLCPFDRVRGTYRDLQPMKKEAALNAMRQSIMAHENHP